MKIYNGTTTSDVLLGEFCGVSVPKDISEIIADNEFGALTFEFYSDGSENRDGWKAAISCVSTVTSISEKFKNSVNVYPNPGDGNFTIEIPNLERKEMKLEVYSFSGQKILSQTITSDKGNIDLSSFSNGVYYLKIFSEKEIINKKLILQK